MAQVRTIEDLKGEYLSEVSFVMDYIQFGFSGSTLTAYSRPLAETNGKEVRFPDLGSRDCLCSFIGHHVLDVTVDSDVQIVLTFEMGRIIVPLDADSRVQGDAAEFWPGVDHLMIEF